MTFADRITRIPRPFDPDRGADTAAQAPWADGAIREILAGTAGCSPFLAGLISKESDWLERAVDDPEAAFRACLHQIVQTELSQAKSVFRRNKGRIAVLAGLADVAGVWTLEEVTDVLSRFASACVDRAAHLLVAQERARGKLPFLPETDAAPTGGYCVLAMGKMGAGELNYSSDIDLICLFDETLVEPDDYHEARASFIRVTRAMASLLSDVTADGYVFRTDLRLRPDASVTPVCLSMEAAERYYESVGRTWERAAYIKANPCGGDVDAGHRFLTRLHPFVWRKHLDFAAIQDAHDMRLRIRDHKGLHGPLTLEGHNMKLGRGGIREIEFFTQTRQLIAGGRDPSLRLRGTVESLAALTASDWVAKDVSAELSAYYRAHREVEHRLQMINDAQTHNLPKDEAGFERLASFMDQDVAGFRRDLLQKLEAVHELTEGFFAPTAPKSATGEADWGAKVVEGWRRYPAFRSPRANAIFDRLWPEIRAKLLDAPKPDEALAQFDGFLGGLPAGVQLFSLFEANPQLTQLIVDIVATAPALSRYLSRNAGVLDAVLGGGFFEPWPSVQVLTGALSATLSDITDYETALNASRRWGHEQHFRIGVHQLRGLIDAQTSARYYADLAEAVVAGIWPVVLQEFARKHGTPPGRGAMVLGMGSLGAGRLNAVSDLDLIVIYDPCDVDTSDGPRPLPSRTYYARLTQALVTALSAPMADGRLYEVDMRLRPSGRQGPVATALPAFATYQANEAWTWEHLALTRAKPVAGADPLMQEVATVIHDVLREKAREKAILQDVREMRQRLADAKPGQGVWDMRNGPGRLQDLELFAQTAALRAADQIDGPVPVEFEPQIQCGVAAGWLDAATATALSGTYRLLWTIHAAARLLSGTVIDPDAVGAGGREHLLREAGMSDLDALAKKIVKQTQAAAAIIDAKLGEL